MPPVVTAVPEAIARARACLEQFEALWRHRITALDAVLSKPRDVELFIVSAGTGFENAVLAWAPEGDRMSLNVLGFAGMVNVAVARAARPGRPRRAESPRSEGTDDGDWHAPETGVERGIPGGLVRHEGRVAHRSSRRFVRVAAVLVLIAMLGDGRTAAQDSSAANGMQTGTVGVGRTGFDVKRPVFASACPDGCPWGELGEFVRDAMTPYGYDVVLCRNCNRAEGPRVVAGRTYPPPLDPREAAVGTTERVDAPVDFGVTESGLLAAAYDGRGAYAKDGPYRNLRLIAKIEDPMYLLAAVKKDSSITDVAQIRARHLPVRILASLSTAQAVLDYYGLTRQAVESWGGSFLDAMAVRGDPDFDVIISDLATPSNNPESAYWPRLSQLHDLRFLDFAPDLLDRLAANEELGLMRVTAKWGLLRGIDRPIPTVARSGEAIFGRADMPDDVAYEVARAIDEHRGALEWYIRPYFYNSATAWKNFDVPLHPGAARYYREKGDMK